MTDIMLTLTGIACLIGGFGILAVCFVAYVDSLIIRLDIDDLHP